MIYIAPMIKDRNTFSSYRLQWFNPPYLQLFPSPTAHVFLCFDQEPFVVLQNCVLDITSKGPKIMVTTKSKDHVLEIQGE